MAEVALEGVGKTYGNGIRAVGGVDLRVAEGELVVLVGPSGCGKTTTLRLIAGLETPTGGVIRIGGRVVNGEPPHRRDVAMVFQRPALYPHLSVAANLGFGLEVRQARPWPICWWDSLRKRLGKRADADGERVRRVEEVARLLHLGDVLGRPPSELSGGQQQRVALGRALVRRPAVFLLDEPLSNLDARLRLEMRRELHLLHRRLRATMVYVTHDQEEALTLGDRVVVLDRGEVQQADSPAALYERPANRFVAAFVGWPTINLLDGQLIEDNGRLRFVADGCELEVPDGLRDEWKSFRGRDLTLGVRPERVMLAAGTPAASTTTLAMEIGLVEQYGAARLVTLERGAWTVTASHGGPFPGREHDRIPVSLALEAAHLFDRATGKALSHGRP